MKILCGKCKRPVAFAAGRLISIKRGDDTMQVVGDNYNVLSSCAGHCGNLTAIMVDKGQLIKDDLTIDNLGDGGNNVHEEQKPDQG